MDCSPPGSSVLGILQVRILEWVAISSSRGSSQHRDPIHDSCISCIAGIFFTTGIVTPLQYSYLENSMDRGAWWITFHGVAKNQIQQNKHIQNHKIKKTGWGQSSYKPQTCSSGSNSSPRKFSPICSIFEKGRCLFTWNFFSDLPCCLTTLIQYIRIC